MGVLTDIRLAEDYLKLLEEKGNLEVEIFNLKSYIEQILTYGEFTDSERIDNVKNYLSKGKSEITDLFFDDTPFN